MTGAARGYLRYPTISGDLVVFACEDDLWSVPAGGGPARRLTAGVSEASHPRLSPGGDRVAFVAADDGPTEIYATGIDAGPARRLTFQAAARCAVVGWHPVTGEVVYASTGDRPAGLGLGLFAVSPAGGPPRPLGLGRAATVSFGPGGGTVLGTGQADPARWKRYRGGAAGELWVDWRGAGSYTRLVSLPGNLANPCWVGDRIYFLSDHDGVGNVYSCRPDGTGLERHTGHADHYARNLATDGARLVYHAGARLYLIDPNTGVQREIPVGLATSRTQHRRRFVPAGDYLETARLSPDGTSLAVLARGKVFTLEPWSGPVRRPGAADHVRYREPSWLSDGRRLAAVASDDGPAERLVVLTGDEVSDLVTEDLGCVTELVAAPASGMVAFTTNRQQLWAVDADSPQPRPLLLDTSQFERIEDLAWSPDGRWLAYTFPDTPRTSAIKVAEPATGRTFAVTTPVLRDCRPAFDPAGRYLYFLGQRELTADLDQVQADVGFPFGTRPYLLTLRAGDPAPFQPGYRTGDARDGVEIDLAGIERRVVAFPVPEGRYTTVFGLPGKALVLSLPVTVPDPAATDDVQGCVVTQVDLATAEVTEDYLDSVDDLHVSNGATVLLYRDGDRLRVLAADATREAIEELDGAGSPGRRSGWVDLDRVKVPVHPVAEWRQMVREAWRLQRECFWHAGMSGIHWEAMYQRYAPLADLVGSRAELSDLLWELQGELATSHAYERGGDYRKVSVAAQGFLGVDWAGTGSGWRVARVLRGDPWLDEATSPCGRPGVDLAPGDAVLAVNGEPVGPAGPGALLVGQAGRDVELTVRRDGSPARQVVVRPIAGEARARYLDWVAANRAHVHTASGGRLGYLHVPDMFRTGYADFVRGFLAELDREGLVVDVRFNGGGHVSPLILDRLSRRRSGIEHGRWSGAVPYPLEAPRGPMVALINEQTGSDGEIFCHVFRTLGLGALIGRRTWGGVIATWPRHRLADGTVTTQPEFRYYLRDVADGLENAGVAPDIEVDAEPGDDGADGQLATAVRHLLDQLAPPRREPARAS